jgi:phage FluMu protein Com
MALSLLRAQGDLETPFRPARCEGKREGRGQCNKLLLRYTTDCLVPGGMIEVKCPSCNHVTMIGLDESHKQ